MSETIYSVGTFAAALEALCNLYLTHFDPGAPSLISSLRLEVSGPELNVTFAQTGLEKPTLHIQLQAVATDHPLRDLSERKR